MERQSGTEFALFIFIEIQFSQIICLVSFVASTELSAWQTPRAHMPVPAKGLPLHYL